MADQQQPDVRVRFSAEGIEEVIKAWRRIQTEGQKIGKTGPSALDAITAAGKRLIAILPAITFAGTITSLALLAKQSLDTADAMGKLAQKTGLTTETLSVLAFAARTADVEQEQLNTSLRVFQRVMAESTAGTKKANDAIEQLFGSRKALERLDDDARLLKVVDALAKLEPGAKRTALAMEFFGRSGAELLPLIDDLGNGGFDQLREKAERLGLVIDEDLARAAQRANDAMTDLRSVVDGITTRFLSGFAPALAEAGEVLVEFFSNGEGGFEDLGKAAGDALKSIVKQVLIAGIEINKWYQEFKAIVENARLLAADVLSGNFSGAIERHDQRAFNNAFAIEKAIQLQLAAVDVAFAQAEQRTKNRQQKRSKIDDPGDLVDLDAIAKAAKARLQLQEQLLNQELALAKATFKLRNAQEREAFGENEADIQRHFARRRLLAEREADVEIDILREQQALVESERPKDEAEVADRERRLSEIKNKILLREIELRTDLISLRGEERKAIDAVIAKIEEEREAQSAAGAAHIKAEDEALEEEARRALAAFQLRRDAENRLLELQGRSHEARLRQIDDEANEEIRRLVDAGIERKAAEQIANSQRRENLRILAEEEKATVDAIERRRLELQGKRHEVAKRDIQEEARIIDEQLKAAGFGDDERGRRVQTFVDAASARLRFDTLIEQSRNSLDEIQTRREDIQAEVRAGVLFQFEADQQILAMERERLSVLERIAAETVQAAEATGDPEAINQAQELLRVLRDLRIETDESAQSAARFKASLQDIVDSSLLDFFTRGIDEAESFGEVFKNIARSIVSDLRRMIAEMIVAQIRLRALSAITGLFGGGLGSAGAGDLAGGATLNAASGGLIRGPGTGTSDSIPAWLSAGEFVVNARSTKRWLHLLKQINESDQWTVRPMNRIPRFADGGLVADAAGGGSFTGEVGIRIEDDAISARIIRNPKFRDGVLKIINENPKAFGAALGRR
jgi:hypothetical protein